MDTITYQGVTYTYKHVESKLMNAEKDRLDLVSGNVSARDIVGPGYTSPVSVARQYTAEQVARWRALLDVMKEN